MNILTILLSILVIAVIISGSYYFFFRETTDELLRKLNPYSRNLLKIHSDSLDCKQDQYSLDNKTICFECKNVDLCSRYFTYPDSIISLSEFNLIGNYTQKDKYNFDTLGVFGRLGCDPDSKICGNGIVYNSGALSFSGADASNAARKKLKCDTVSSLLICGNVLLESDGKNLYVQGVYVKEKVISLNE